MTTHLFTKWLQWGDYIKCRHYLLRLWILSAGHDTWVLAISQMSAEVRRSYFNTLTLCSHLSRSLSFTYAIYPCLWVSLQAGPSACPSPSPLIPKTLTCLCPTSVTAPKAYLSSRTYLPLPHLSQGLLGPFWLSGLSFLPVTDHLHLYPLEGPTLHLPSCSQLASLLPTHFFGNTAELLAPQKLWWILYFPQFIPKARLSSSSAFPPSKMFSNFISQF